MKFIFVNILMGMYRGGGENYDLNLSRELAMRGHEVEFYCLRPIFGGLTQRLPDFCTVHPIRAPWLYLWTQRMHGIPVIGRIRGLRGFFRALGQLLFEIRVLFCLWQRRREPFIVHICGLSFLGMLATKMLGNRVFLRMPGPPSFSIHQFFLRHTYQVIANGDAFNCIKRLARDINLVRLEVGVDHLLFQRTAHRVEARKKLGLPSHKILALFVGRLIPLKNLDMLIRAFVRITKTRVNIDLIVVGTGPDREKLEQAAFNGGLKDRIHFLDEAYGDRLLACYTAADLFVLPSVYDNFPNVVLEAMAMELPVIATKVGGIPSQICDGKTGYLVELNDDEAMALKVIEMANKPMLRLALGRKAQAIVSDRFNWGLTAESFLTLASQSKEPKID